MAAHEHKKASNTIQLVPWLTKGSSEWVLF